MKITINEEFFNRPKDLPLLQEVQQGFEQWLKNYVEKPIESENISRRLPSYFVYALKVINSLQESYLDIYFGGEVKTDSSYYTEGLKDD